MRTLLLLVLAGVVGCAGSLGTGHQAKADLDARYLELARHPWWTQPVTVEDLHRMVEVLTRGKADELYVVTKAGKIQLKEDTNFRTLRFLADDRLLGQVYGHQNELLVYLDGRHFRKRLSEAEAVQLLQASLDRADFVGD